MNDDPAAGLVCFVFFCWLVWIVGGAILGEMFRGRPWIGAGLGWLLGPIGWALIKLLEDRRCRCPACIKKINPLAVVCPYCRTDVRALKPVPPSQPKGVLDMSMTELGASVAGAFGGQEKQQPIAAAPASVATPAIKKGGRVHCGRCHVEAIEDREFGEPVYTCPRCSNRVAV